MPPGEGKGYPLQYSGLKNSKHCILHGEAKIQTRLSDFSLSQLPSRVRAAVWAGCLQRRALFTSTSSILRGSCEHLSLDRTLSLLLLWDACLWDQPLKLGWQLHSLTPPQLCPQGGPCPCHAAHAISSCSLPRLPVNLMVQLPSAFAQSPRNHLTAVSSILCLTWSWWAPGGSPFTQVDGCSSRILFVSLRLLYEDRFEAW